MNVAAQNSAAESNASSIIVALDVDGAAEARSIVDELRGIISTFKVGLQLYTAGGPELVRELVAKDLRIFLDLKFHDIPNTVAKASIEAARLGVWMFNVHASGGREMMSRAFEETAEFCAREAAQLPKMIGVTVLTSSDDTTLDETGVRSSTEEQVLRLARLTSAAGLDGVVASAREIERIRDGISREDFLIVTPGIRPDSATNDDQKRVMTPGSALDKGADHLVIGRPITGAKDKAQAAESIINEIREHQDRAANL